MNSRKTCNYIDSIRFFAAGAFTYPAAELLWRGRTHWTMALTGGACAALIHIANRRMQNRRFILRCAAGSIIITSAELIVGCIVNRILGWNVWDYSKVAFNIMGQICPQYCLMWFILSIPVVGISNYIISRRSCAPIVFS